MAASGRTWLELKSSRSHGRLSRWHFYPDCSGLVQEGRVRPVRERRVEVRVEGEEYVCVSKGKQVGTLCHWCRHRIEAA